jgi:alkylhydroperoxidase family enzyme
MLGASFPQGRINDKDREMIIIRVAALSKSAYERMQHLPLALQAGWGMAQIAAIEDGTLPGKRENAILNYVDECVHHVRVSETTFSQAAAFFSETQLAELTLLIGHYMMTARFLESLNIDLDHTATSWDAV